MQFLRIDTLQAAHMILNNDEHRAGLCMRGKWFEGSLIEEIVGIYPF